MSTTKVQVYALLSFFEAWVQDNGPEETRKTFESDEYEGGSGLVRYDQRTDSLDGVFLTGSTVGRVTPFTMTYGNWLLSRLRPQVDGALVRLSRLLEKSGSREEGQLIVDSFVNRATALRDRARRVTDTTFRLAVTSHLTRVIDDARLIAGQTEEQSKRRGGRPAEIDVERLKSDVLRLVESGRFRHPKGRSRAGTVNRSAVAKKLMQDADGPYARFEHGALSRKVKLVVERLVAGGDLSEPEG